MISQNNDQRVFWTENIGISFGGLIAIDSVSIEVHRDEVLGLIGPNGSGKTTMFNMITGLYEADHGDFFLEGKSLRGKAPHEISREGIARTFQANRLCLNLSVIDNLLIAMQYKQNNILINSVFNRKKLATQIADAREKCLELLAVFNADLLNRVGERAERLPQIDRRRVEICRAIAMNPKLLLLDEPSAGMTGEENSELMDDIRRVKRSQPGISIIIIEHDMGVISSISDRVVALNYGKKIAEGTFNQVASNELVREAYLGKREYHD